MNYWRALKWWVYCLTHPTQVCWKYLPGRPNPWHYWVCDGHILCGNGHCKKVSK